MNLAEWQKTFKRGECSDIIPVFKIDENNKAVAMPTCTMQISPR